jgi:hypothetical protein
MFCDEHVPTFCDLDMLILFSFFKEIVPFPLEFKEAPPGKSTVV